MQFPMRSKTVSEIQRRSGEFSLWEAYGQFVREACGLSASVDETETSQSSYQPLQKTCHLHKSGFANRVEIREHVPIHLPSSYVPHFTAEEFVFHD